MREHSATVDEANGKKEWSAVAALSAMAAYLFWLGQARPPGLKVPAFAAYLLALAVAASALALAAKIRRRTAANHGLVVVTLLTFSAVGSWIALSRTGAAGCMVRFGRAASDLSRPLMEAPESTCRVVFGSGAILSAAMAGWAGLLWWRVRRD